LINGRSMFIAALSLIALTLLLIVPRVIIDNPSSQKASIFSIDDISEKLDKILKKIDEVLDKLFSVNESLCQGHLEILSAIKDVNASLSKLSNAIHELRITVKDINKTRPLNETLIKLVSRYAEAINNTLNNLKEDLEAMIKARETLIKVQAVAGVIADKAFDEAKAGNLTTAEILAYKALNITYGVIKAYHEKALVLQEYAKAFYYFCEGIYLLSQAIKNLVMATAA